ncbi:hypothetical protein [Thalassovita mediterranea]|jgi:hypothetical protein|uniref:Uncharacterized protein n=2 Tax=Thalassovita mediterranea TaxID=340021 RepID=A0A0P1GLG6_9RHOB|nr:hypothetical protein [Thalassovita mediterranea]MCG7574758.1 hypothetical protein [Phaeobacter sp. CNT1-3]CUH83193.1 hypothetical protein TM5383_00377 [Thalassovita mediterranea]SIS33465.1 hypothetical protein SAMN05421685_108106 [Thalassovita mediterranea]
MIGLGRIALLLGVLSTPAAASAQEVVGTSAVGGKRVHLYSDGTWEYAKESGEVSRCVALHKSVDFCGSILNWRPVKARGDFSNMFLHSDRIQSGLLIEELGTNDGFSVEYMRTVALEAAAEASGVDVSQIPVLGFYDVQIGETAAENMVYGASIDGLKIVYSNTIIVADTLTLQAIVWSIGDDYTEEHQKWNADFLENLRVRTEGEKL